MAAIYTINSETITEGLQGCNQCDEALQIAKRIAVERKEAVVLADDDGIWRVEPDGKVGGPITLEYVHLG